MAPGFDAPLRVRVSFAFGWGALMWAGVVVCWLLVVAIGGVSRSGVPLDWGSVVPLAGLTGVLGLVSFPIFYALRPWHRHRVGCFAAAFVAVAPSAFLLYQSDSMSSVLKTRALSVSVFVLLFAAMLSVAQWLTDHASRA